MPYQLSTIKLICYSLSQFSEKGHLEMQFISQIISKSALNIII
ncbi:hypothetical protein Sinf_0417 [Streptococcus infantarius subsp. infantarius CJ18]|nr:hypothetical protein Sinf_0417 [Streptococcus infantarius subsp. infantarius CJ18]